MFNLSAAKYNPNHLGPGTDGGQFTTADRNGTSYGLPPGSWQMQRSELAPPSQAGAAGVRVAQKFPPVIGNLLDVGTASNEASTVSTGASAATGAATQTAGAAVASESAAGSAITEAASNTSKPVAADESVSGNPKYDWKLGDFKFNKEILLAVAP